MPHLACTFKLRIIKLTYLDMLRILHDYSGLDALRDLWFAGYDAWLNIREYPKITILPDTNKILHGPQETVEHFSKPTDHLISGIRGTFLYFQSKLVLFIAHLCSRNQKTIASLYNTCCQTLSKYILSAYTYNKLVYCNSYHRFLDTDSLKVGRSING